MSDLTIMATAPGSARASRAQFGASPNCSAASNDHFKFLNSRRVNHSHVAGEAPATAREARALPGENLRLAN